MFQTRSLKSLAVAAAMFSMFAFKPALADRDDHDEHFEHGGHLDRWEIRQTVRHMEERNDTLQDHLYDWISQRRDEREHRAGEMLRAADHFDQNLAQFKLDLYHHDDPWELHDEAQNVIDTAGELGRVIDHDDEWHGELHQTWEDVRDSANELAHQYHLREIEGWHR